LVCLAGCTVGGSSHPSGHHATSQPSLIHVGNSPVAIAITPNARTAYVANSGDATVTPISPPAGTPGAPIRVAKHPDAIAITADGRTAYVASDLAATGPGYTPPRPGKVTPIDLATGTAGKPIQVGLLLDAIAITTDGRAAYVANKGLNVGGIGHTVTPISLATGTPGPAIQVGNGPFAIAITTDGRTAYVVTNAHNTVTPIKIK
jgi:hyaluronoglucosaminidase